jgi:hypothetical protein
MLRTDLKWAVFRQRAESGEVHVAPAYSDGLILEHHIIDVLCPCKPIPQDRLGWREQIIVVHNEPGMPE